MCGSVAPARHREHLIPCLTGKVPSRRVDVTSQIKTMTRFLLVDLALSRRAASAGGQESDRAGGRLRPAPLRLAHRVRGGVAGPGEQDAEPFAQRLRQPEVL